MPLVRDVSGHTAYVRLEELYADRPEDFFHTNPEELLIRQARARWRILEAIRFAARPLGRHGTCHEVRINPELGDCVEQLTNYIDQRDGQRCAQVRQQNSRTANGLWPVSYRRRSPQDVRRRRSALFGGKDIPADHFGRKMSQNEIDRFVDLMRWYLLEEAIRTMRDQHELELVGDTWYVPVSVMDEHRIGRRTRPVRREVKHDDRSFHGRTNANRKQDRFKGARERDRTQLAA